MVRIHAGPLDRDKMDIIEIKERLLRSIKVSDSGCWEWQKSKRVGYGILIVERKSKATHRLSYEVFKGSIPDGLLVCHKCDNRCCINPDHLFLGTHSDNMKDCSMKGRLKIPNTSRFKLGHGPVNSLLSKSERLAIWNQIQERGQKTLKQLADDLNVPYQMIRDMSRPRLKKVFA